MNILVLGGNSARHQAWVRQAADVLRQSFKNVAFLDYRHWDTKSEIDLEYEIQHATEAVAALGQYFIVAKSIGTIIATLGIYQQRLRPVGCVFLGLPLVLIEKHPEWVPAFKILPEIHIIQNEHDPYGAASEVSKFISVHCNEQTYLHITPGDTHDYMDFTLVSSLAAGIDLPDDR